MSLWVSGASPDGFNESGGGLVAVEWVKESEAYTAMWRNKWRSYIAVNDILSYICNP